MRAAFGLISLLVVLAIVGLLAANRVRSGSPAVAGATSASGAALPPREQARQIQQQVQSDVTKALEQGAAQRRDEADK